MAVPFASVAAPAPQAVPGRRSHRVRRRHQRHRRHEHAAPQTATRGFCGERRRPAAAGDRADDAARVGAGAAGADPARAKCRCFRSAGTWSASARRPPNSSLGTTFVTGATSSTPIWPRSGPRRATSSSPTRISFPGIRFRRALAAAAQRGVRVTLLLQAQGRVPAAALRVACAVRAAAAGGRHHPGVSPQHVARQGRGDRRSLGHGRIVEHRSLQPAHGARGQRLRARSRLQRRTQATARRNDLGRVAPSRGRRLAACGRGSTRRRSGSPTGSCASAMGLLGYGGNEWFRGQRDVSELSALGGGIAPVKLRDYPDIGIRCGRASHRAQCQTRPIACATCLPCPSRRPRTLRRHRPRRLADGPHAAAVPAGVQGPRAARARLPDRGETRQRRRAAGAQADRRRLTLPPAGQMLVLPVALLVAYGAAAPVDDGVHRAARIFVRQGHAARGAHASR